MINRFDLAWWLNDITYPDALVHDLGRRLKVHTRTDSPADLLPPRILPKMPKPDCTSVYVVGEAVIPRESADRWTGNWVREHLPAMATWQRENGVRLCRLDFDREDAELHLRHVEIFPVLNEEPAALVQQLERRYSGDARMILVLGSSKDNVFPALNRCLRESGHPFIAIDEDNPCKHSVKREASNGQSVYRIVGDGDCTGETPVNAIFVRHAVARTLDAKKLQEMGHLQGGLNYMLRVANCPILNPPANALSNYSKAYQVALLAEAGFDVPRSLVTNIPDDARAFWEECKREVIYKGVSNMTTLAQLLTEDKSPWLDLLPCSPTALSGVRRRR